jgi:hypothetical protein
MKFGQSQYLPLSISLPPLTRTNVRVNSAENAANDRLVQTPKLYLLALTQFAISADTEVVSLEPHLVQPTQANRRIHPRCAPSRSSFSLVSSSAHPQVDSNHNQAQAHKLRVYLSTTSYRQTRCPPSSDFSYTRSRTNHLPSCVANRWTPSRISRITRCRRGGRGMRSRRRRLV